jgi:hypothetical protein
VDVWPSEELDVSAFAFDWLADELVNDLTPTGARDVVFPLVTEER